MLRRFASRIEHLTQRTRDPPQHLRPSVGDPPQLAEVSRGLTPRQSRYRVTLVGRRPLSPVEREPVVLAASRIVPRIPAQQVPQAGYRFPGVGFAGRDSIAQLANSLLDLTRGSLIIELDRHQFDRVEIQLAGTATRRPRRRTPGNGNPRDTTRLR